MSVLTILCWRCREPLDESEAVKVRVHPDRPEWMSQSITSVHPGCIDGEET